MTVTLPQIKLRHPSKVKRWEKADASRNVQDEYCEWSVRRDEKGNILSVTFTCEGPEVSSSNSYNYDHTSLHYNPLTWPPSTCRPSILITLELL